MLLKDLPAAEQAIYSMQCRTLVRTMTGIHADVRFENKLKAPAMMCFSNSDHETYIKVDLSVPAEAVAGLVIHECGHVLATDPHAFAAIAKKCEGKSATYINIVEDYRINVGVLGRLYPWCVQYLSEALRALEIRGLPAVDAPSQIVNCIFKDGVPLGADPIMLADAQAYVEQWGPSIVGALTTGELEAAALALEALDKKHGKLQEPEPVPDEEEERQQQVYGAAADELEEAMQEAMGQALAKALAKAQAEAEEKGEEIKDSPCRSSSRGEGDFGGSPCHDQKAGFVRALSLLSGMRNRLHDAIVSEDTGGPVRHLNKGQLDCRRVAYATSTDTVFMAPRADIKRVNTAVDVVIDCSGSMSSLVAAGISRAHLAAATAHMLGVALARVDGARVGVLLYDNDCKRVHEIHPMRGISQDRGSQWAMTGGGTNTDVALDRSTKDLLAVRSVRRRISLIITDDEAAEEDHIKAAQRLGVEAYCLCIDSRRESTLRVKHCNEATQLPGTVAALVKAMFVEAR